MTFRRVFSFGVSTLALASWFSAASTPDVDVPTPATRVAPRVPTALDRSSALLQSEIDRLHDRLAPTSRPSHSRDLFRFNAPKPRRPSQAAAPIAAAVEQAEPVQEQPPALKLIGVAEDASSEGVVRTAILSGLGDVFLVKAGDVVSGRFRIDQVAPDAVQITNVATAAVTTLALR